MTTASMQIVLTSTGHACTGDVPQSHNPAACAGAGGGRRAAAALQRVPARARLDATRLSAVGLGRAGGRRAAAGAARALLAWQVVFGPALVSTALPAAAIAIFGLHHKPLL